MIRRPFAVAALALVLAGAAVQWLPSAAAAQDQWIELLRTDFKTQKVAILTEAMDFAPEQAELFWPIYREYDLALSKIGDARVALIKDYAASLEQMTEPKAKELADRSFKIEEDVIKLRRDYYKKVEKAINSSTAARFVMVERQIGMLVDLQIASDLPLISKPAAQ